jgi:hypothetical protein
MWYWRTAHDIWNLVPRINVFLYQHTWHVPGQPAVGNKACFKSNVYTMI